MRPHEPPPADLRVEYSFIIGRIRTATPAPVAMSSNFPALFPDQNLPDASRCLLPEECDAPFNRVSLLHPGHNQLALRDLAVALSSPGLAVGVV